MKKTRGYRARPLALRLLLARGLLRTSRPRIFSCQGRDSVRSHLDPYQGDLSAFWCNRFIQLLQLNPTVLVLRCDLSHRATDFVFSGTNDANVGHWPF